MHTVLHILHSKTLEKFVRHAQPAKKGKQEKVEKLSEGTALVKVI